MPKSNIWTYDGDFLFLPANMTAKKITGRSMIQLLFYIFSGALVVAILFSLLLDVSILIVLSAMLALVYAGAFAFKFAAVIAGLTGKKSALTQIDNSLIALTPDDSPVYRPYSVIIPLYKEQQVVTQIKKAMTALRYPIEKIEFLITLEEYDHETRAEILRNNFPAEFRIITLPDVKPKTKPKALNVAFEEAKGEFVVIYDAEIIPDVDQPKKAAWAFHLNPGIAAFQTRLDHYNAETNVLTGLFNAEFASYYDVVLPGLQKLKIPFPLSGHSTHFRTNVLRDAGGWDPYNVTEDVDVAVRLSRLGYTTGILDSLSKEEATISMVTWVMQRTRWMKGFLQTSLVHMQHPLRLIKDMGGMTRFVSFLFLVPGSAALNLMNLFYLSLTLIWVTFHPSFIQSFFAMPILYLTYLTTVLGVTTSVFLNLLSLYRRGRFGIVIYAYLSPLYWLLLSVSAVRATYQFFIDPISWEKTTHGTHIDTHEHA